ncbi:MAG: iron complex outermembrane receptor protein [Porticoccaceae bacterium]|jgi:iron complex outermembrane receptor protein
MKTCSTWLAAGLLNCLIFWLPTLANAQNEVAGPERARASEASLDAEPGPESEPEPESGFDDDLDALLSFAEGDVEQLSRVKVVAPALQEVVSTVSRQKSTVGKSPAAVFVITNEMIRRSGARSIPEVLRMAPGVQVHRIDSNKWAISIRGFADRFSNKLLVQIDGRSVYTPLFAGVFWDVQDVLLEDVERIEVIRGPGATVWGANAVNGVINVITKKAKDTQGVFVEAGGGTDRGFTSVRGGGEIGDNGWYRAYGKWFERDAGDGQGSDPADDWRMKRGGLRADWEFGEGITFTVQGDYYEGASGVRATIPAPLPAGARVVVHDELTRGGNVLARLTQTIDDDTSWSLQSYYDHTYRSFESVGLAEDRDTIDVDFQHRSSPWLDHSLIWGVGYRYNQDELTNAPFFVSFTPDERDYDLISGFIQDEITLIDDTLTFTAGSKFEHNDFTGFEFQPSIRVLWTPSEPRSIWGAVSRAVRTPSRTEDDGRGTVPAVVPPGFFPVFSGARNSQSEDLVAYELGYREQFTEEFSLDTTVFFHDYNDVVGSTIGAPTFQLPEGPVLPLVANNENSAQTYGFEVASSWQIAPWWRTFGSYSFLRVVGVESHDPHNRFYLQSSWDITETVEFDAVLRYVDSVPDSAVNNYTAMDLRLSWEPTDGMEVFVVGRNLLDRSHPEFFTSAELPTAVTAVRREVFAGINLRF